MKGRKGLFLSAKGIRFLWLGMLILFGLGVNPAVAADSRSQLAEVVRTLGYGGAIHSFKNYVLRGVNRETYAITAQKQFEQARKLLLAMQSNDDFSAVDRTELSAIVGVIDQYLDGLNRIKALFEKGWRTEDIDRVVLVDDVPALQALNRLRKKWQWSAFE